jgi:hypothetical protein
MEKKQEKEERAGEGEDRTGQERTGGSGLTEPCQTQRVNVVRVECGTESDQSKIASKLCSLNT